MNALGYNCRDAHNTFVAAVVRSINQAGIRAVCIDGTREEFVVPGGHHPDFKITIGGVDEVYDVTIAHVLCRTLLSISDEKIVETKASMKIARYTELASKLNFTFYPLVVFSTGKPTAHLQTLAGKLSAECSMSSRWFLKQWNVALAQATGRSIKAMKRSTGAEVVGEREKEE